MFNYSTVASAIVRQIKAHENALPLMDETCRSQFLLQQSFTDKVRLFFHWFTTIPYQFVPIGEAFFKAGYNVLIPLLPGHGIAGDWNKDNPPPLPKHRQSYEQFGLHWLQLAQSFGKKVIMGGLSGSTLAAWLALERPEQIYRTLAFAPYLSGTTIVVDLFVRIFNIYFEWMTKPGLMHYGYDGFLMPALEVFLDIRADVLDRGDKSLAAPMFIVSSASDRVVGNKGS